MPSYKLIYFNGRGRGELARLLFALGGQEFEDFRLEDGDWPKYKPDTPFGQVPVLEIDGKAYAQSGAIANYLAREFGLYGKNNIECFQIEQITGILGDMATAGYKAFFACPDEAHKAKEIKKFKEEDSPRFIGYFEKLLKENGTGYFVGNTVTLADVAVFELVTGFSFMLNFPEITDNFPEIQALIKKIESIDKIKTYLENRKDTFF